ncbi:MAG: LysR family transcriptional regulator [Corallococcus sp.]|nr:LysR family transcriptional regulator [Corallococcus sp.]MCM1359425.1 LysR family transcriptional regulator [Corallococcus sp.]MCM1394868.1 LysR family transcriptional regulator [Corallococcus sp.]
MYNPQIETFIKVADSGSFSKAADALFISPPAVMKQINTLESRLGILLFERTNHGLALTNAGKSFLQDAKYIMEYSSRAIEKAKDIDERDNLQSIRIGTSVMTPAKFVMDMWTEIQGIAPNLKIELIPFENTPENAREILKNLGQHIDIVAGIYDDWLINDRGFQVAHLYDKQILVAVPLTHPFSSKTIITKDDLKQSGIMLIKEGWNKYVDEMRVNAINDGVNVVDFDFFSLNAFNRAVKENVPIMAIDGWESVHPLLKIIRVEWEYTIPYGIMYSREPSNQVKKFIDIVQKINDRGE